MSPLRIPRKTLLTKGLLLGVIVVSPLVVVAHYLIRDFRGDYGIEDAIMIPIASYTILAFPFALLFLVVGLLRYTEGAFLFAWNRRRVGRSIIWTFLLLTPLDWTQSMIGDGLLGRTYWDAAFFCLYFYCLLVLRAGIVAHETSELDTALL